jgi:SPX domain protein involved in polyphosphate accumulation
VNPGGLSDGNPGAARFEVKYLVAPARATALTHDLTAFLRPDDHAVGPSHTYTVRTLYFDSPQRGAYEDKCAGILMRAKYRIRTYAETPSVRFAEIKRRLNNRILKHRTILSVDEYRALLGGCATPGDPLVLSHFHQGILRMHLQPIVCIEYRRRPFVHPGHPRLRVTFDTHITARPARSLEEHRPACTVLPAGASVLEIKFNGTMPHWIHMLVRKYSLTDTAYSKYCLGIESLVRCGVIQHV